MLLLIYLDINKITIFIIEGLFFREPDTYDTVLKVGGKNLEFHYEYGSIIHVLSAIKCFRRQHGTVLTVLVTLKWPSDYQIFPVDVFCVKLSHLFKNGPITAGSRHITMFSLCIVYNSCFIVCAISIKTFSFLFPKKNFVSLVMKVLIARYFLSYKTF